ncbi:MAG: hypothetical protein KF799_05685 [Bdellovibrionales bacterium]|nr:hypothetical protein [Bdellovibrionales bacterium]
MSALLILTLLTAVACTEKGKPYSEHDSARGTLRPRPVTEISPSENAVPLDAMSLQELATRVLSLESVRDPKNLSSRRAQDELITLNNKILNASAEERSSAAFRRVLMDYAQALQTDCGRFADGCIGFKYFDRAPSSAQVAKLIAKHDSQLYFKMLLYAVKLKPTGWDGELAEMLLKKPETTADSEYAKATQSLLEVALQSIQHHRKDVKESRRFLDSIDAWKLISKREWALSDAGGNALYAMLADSGMLYGEKGGLHPGLLQRIQEQSLEPKGYMAQQKWLQSQTDFRVDAIGVKIIPQMDELLYLIDAVYTGKISSDGGVRLFASSKRSVQDLETATQNYFRLQFVVSLLESTRLAKKIFEARVQVEDLFFYAIQESASIQSVWSTFRGRVLPLQNFAISAARARRDSEAAQNRLRLIFESVDKSIAMTSVYPHELVLFHILSQKRFHLRLMNGRTIDTSDLIRMLFEQQFPPLFSYADSQVALNQMELLHAVDMAIRTNLMQAANVDPDDFISGTVQRLSQKPMAVIDSNMGRIANRLDQSADYTTFKQACEEFQSGKLHPRTYYFTQSRSSGYYGKLIDTAFASIASASTTESMTSGSIARTEAALMYMDKSYSELLETARLDLGNSLRAANAMLTSYRSYLKLLQLNETQILEKTKKTRTMIARLEAARERVLRLSKKWYDDIGFCYWPAIRRDVEMATRLLEMETAYLRSIHHRMTRLRSQTLNDSERQRILNSIRFTGLPSGFSGHDQFVDGGYNYSQIDAMIRISRYLKQGLTTESETLPPVAPHVTADLGQKLDLNVDIVRESMQTIIPYSVDEQAFVNSGLQILFRRGAGRAYLNWFGDTIMALTTWDAVLRGMISLHRLELEVRGTTDIAPAADALKTQEEILKFVEITPQQRELYRILRVSNKFMPLMYDYRMLRWDGENSRIINTWGIFDLPVRLAEEEVLGDAWDAYTTGTSAALLPLRLTYISAGQMYFNLRANRPQMVIPFNPDLDRQMTASVRKFVQTEIQGIRAFHSATDNYITQIQKRPVNQRPRFDMNMFESFTSPLLDPNIVSTWNSKIQRFNQTTANCYTANCPIFER